jgi:hypothetical protein
MIDSRQEIPVSLGCDQSISPCPSGQTALQMQNVHSGCSDRHLEGFFFGANGMCLTRRCNKCGEVKPLGEMKPQKQCKGGYSRTCLACTRQYNAAYRVINADRLNASIRAHKKRHPKSVQAQHVIDNEVRRGRLLRPDVCEECQRKCKPHAHHDDYDKPLKVRWVCPSCHKRLHLAILASEPDTQGGE